MSIVAFCLLFVVRSESVVRVRLLLLVVACLLYVVARCLMFVVCCVLVASCFLTDVIC